MLITIDLDEDEDESQRLADRRQQTNPPDLPRVSILPLLRLHLHTDNINRAFYNYDLLELAPVCFLNSATIVFSLLAGKQCC